MKPFRFSFLSLLGFGLLITIAVSGYGSNYYNNSESNSTELKSDSAAFDIGQFLPRLIAYNADTLVDILDPDISLEADGRVPLLLIHGWGPEGRPAKPGPNQWRQVLDFLLSDPTLRKYFKPYIVTYWSNAVPVAQLSGALRNHMQWKGLHEQKIIILAHSMGGLVSRSYMVEQSFNTGHYANIPCGDQVKMLLTLGTPHHGSPMANGPARDAKLNFILRALVSLVEKEAFGNNKYNMENRSDMLWDNYDNFYNLNSYPNERNSWLMNLNTNTMYDHKMVCYASWITGKLTTSVNTMAEKYQLGAYFQKEGLNYNNDGIVPYKSAIFDGHPVKRIRQLTGYNHQEINTGKEGNDELVQFIKTDLLPFIPLHFTEPVVENLYLKAGHYTQFQWVSPEDISTVNMYYSIDNGLNWISIFKNFDAKRVSYAWKIPEVNATNVLFKIANAADETEFALTKSNITLYHNQINIHLNVEKPYVTTGSTDTIFWAQQGLGNQVSIRFIDLKNGTSKLLAESYSTIPGNNFFVWTPDDQIVASDSAHFELQLLGLAESIGDTETYKFRSGKFSVYETAKLALHFESADEMDAALIPGRRLEIDSVYQAKLQYSGAVEKVKLSLCDTLGNVLASLVERDLIPGQNQTVLLDWTAPHLRRNDLILCAVAFDFYGNLIGEAYSAKAFRINSYPRLQSPQDSASNVSLQPCFQLNESQPEASHSLELKASNGIGFEASWSGNQWCAPQSATYELEVGTEYQINLTTAYFDGNSYILSQTFTTQATAPLPFTIVKPATDSILTKHQVELLWSRSVGATGYTIQLEAQGKIISSEQTRSKVDTTLVVDLKKYWNSDTLFVQITAWNSFGETSTSGWFFNTSAQGIAKLPTAGSKPSFEVVTYPNPFGQKVTLSVTLPEALHNNRVKVDIFNNLGQHIQTLYDDRLTHGSHLIGWDGTTNQSYSSAPGMYFIRVQVAQETVVERVLLK
jgi:triacylglycerol esterase/lipase EstA (alpha/beta hydrolase family)